MEVDITEFSDTEDAAGCFGVNWCAGGGKVVGGRGVEDADFVTKIESGSEEHPGCEVSMWRRNLQDLTESCLPG